MLLTGTSKAVDVVGHVGTVAGIFGPGILVGLAWTLFIARRYSRQRAALTLRDDAGALRTLSPGHLRAAEIAPLNESGTWAMDVAEIARRERPFVWRNGRRTVETSVMRLTGADAVRAVRVMLPLINNAGGDKREVDDALRFMQRQVTGDPVFSTLFVPSRRRAKLEPLPIGAITPTRLLGLEMAMNEDLERRALEGELALLEHAWREAEEIAAIADDLLVPPTIREKLEARSGD